MKKILLGLLITATGSVFAQNTGKDIFSAKSIVWYGLNFSEARMVGQFDQAAGAGTASSSDLKNKWIPGWNTLIVSEPQNFKLGEAFRKNDVYYDLAPTEKDNQSINLDKFMSFNPYTFTDAQKTVQGIISKLGTGDKKEGIGVTFIVESFNKSSDEASVYVTIFDIKTKSILVLDKITGKPKGIGLRNFWAGAIKHIIKQINDYNYKSWESKTK
ncbi:MAG: hypothetical protein HY062_10560 [Bacteroidetes bacterium]|nr:hypothetical protein [Bacteroidota bacterium]